MGVHLFADVYTIEEAQAWADRDGVEVKHHQHPMEPGGFNDDNCVIVSPNRPAS